MRRIQFSATAALMLSAAPIAAQDRMVVATTFTVLADIAANVAGDAADVVSITRPGAEIHGYSPTPRDILRAILDEAHRLMLLLAIQRELGEKSNWGCYIDALPAEYDTLMFWSDKQLQELAGEFATHLVRCAYLHSVAQ